MKKLLLITFLISCSLSALAQMTPQEQERITQEQQRIMNEQQRLIDEEIRQRELEEALRRPTEINVPSAETPEIFESGNCVEIIEVHYSGNVVLKNSDIDPVIDKYTGKCLNLNDINTMLQDITNLYIDKGYVTSRAFMQMPQSRLNEQILEIVMVEGKISTIEGLKRKEIFFAFPSVEGKVLDLRAIEQGLDQINRLGYANATLDIQADAMKDGYSQAVITKQTYDRSNISLFFDNAGSESTGEWRGGLRFSHDNLIGINDQINLSYTKPFSNDYNRKDANSFTFGLSIPFGYWNISNNFSFSNNLSSFKLPVSGDLLKSTGETFNDSLSISRLLARGQKYKISAGIGLTVKDTKSFTEVLGTKIKNEAASRRLTVFNAELPMTFYLNNGVIYAKPSYHRGLTFFNALDDKEVDYTQSAQFNLYKLYSYYSRRVGPGSLTVSVDAQYSPDELFGSESMYIGGEGSVRGFKTEGTQGDMGFTLRSEYRINLGKIPVEHLKHYDITLFLDYGLVSSHNENYKTHDLSGGGAKLTANYKYFSLSVAYAKALNKSDGITEDHAVYFYSDFSYSF